jgi:thiamine pyrophosphate-dependent acetolactate synthase large subunit-like protein
VDFKKYAEALGVKAFHAENAEEFRQALQTAKTEKTSTLIEVKV